MHFNLTQKSDCIFSNAALQWVSNHEMLIPSLLNLLKPNGVLAIQMPNNWHCPSRQVTIKVLHYRRLDRPFYNPAKYYDILVQAGAKDIAIWQTDYIQPMDNYQAIFDWVKGTGLRPVLSRMTDTEQMKFIEAYIAAITRSYPEQKDGKVLLPYTRFF